MIETPSPNHDARADGTPVDMLVIHYTGMRSGAEALARLCDAAAEVSAHYLIDEAGAVHRMVAEERRAWHAGVAQWRGHSDINARSIGIELVNPGHEFGYRRFPEPQMAAFRRLAGDILGRHAIPARNVVGHSDVAPTRKQDPGELFDWRGLAAAGIGIWPEAAGADEPDDRRAAEMLGEYGYDTADLGAAVSAFQRHFQPERLDGTVDQATMACLGGLIARIA